MTGGEMWQRFTNMATRVIHFARVEAMEQGVRVVGTEHILIGLAREQEGFAARVLAQLGVSLEQVREEYARQPFAPKRASTGPQRLTLSPLAKYALELTLEECRMLHAHHGRPDFVDTEHMLLGLLRAGSAAHSSVLLTGMGIDLDGAYQEVIRQLDQLPTSHSGQQTTRPPVLSVVTHAVTRPMTHSFILSLQRYITGVFAALFDWRKLMPATVISTPDVPPEGGDGNAIDHFFAAGKLLVDRERILALKVVAGEPPLAQLEERGAVLQQNAAVLAKVREGFAVAYRYPRITDLSAKSPLTGVFQPIMHLFAMNARVKTAQGDYAGAVQSCVDGIRLGVIIPRGGILITHMMGTICERICRNALRPLVAHLNFDQVRQTCEALETIERLRTPFTEVVEEEALVILRYIDLLIEDADALLRCIPEDVKDRDIYVQLASLSHTEREAVKETTLRFLEVTRARMALPYTPDEQWWQEEADALSRDMLASLAGFFQQAHLREAETRLQAGFTMVHLAMQAYGLTHGGRPASLEALVPEYLPSVPTDPFTANSPIGYQWNEKTCTIFSAVPEGLDAQKYRVVITSSFGFRGQDY